VLVVGATAEAASEVVRAATVRTGGGFGWRRITLYRLAAELALPELGRLDLAPATALAMEAVCARVVARLSSEGRLGRFAPVADLPGLPRALSHTLHELRLAGSEPEALPDDLGPAHHAFGEALRLHGLADRAAVLRAAATAIHEASASPLLRVPTLLVDVPVEAGLEADLLRAIGGAAPEVLATVPVGDARSTRHLVDALGVDPTPLPPSRSDALSRLQMHLFSQHTPPPGELGEEVRLLSAPGESRECVEIVRHVHREAARGVPFDRMAILLHAPAQYRAHVQEALRRAGIPAWFSRGTRAPDPSGRALLALLACKAEGLSARGFAEYLSLGEVPDADAAGAPPPARPSAELFVPPDEDLVPEALARAEAETPPDDEGVLGDGPVVAGTLRAPRRWEQLIVDAAVIGGLDRWERRLDGLDKQLRLDLRELEPEAPARARVERKLAELGRLYRFGLPLLRALGDLPDTAAWGEWLDHLSALASRAVRHPDRVLAVLSELRPMASTGPVGLDEVRLVLGQRLTELVERPRQRRYGRVFVGSMACARGLSFDVVYVPGLAERLFPRKVTEDPMLLDAERTSLPGLAVNADRVEAERTALRLAVGAARERVVLSWPRVDVDQARPRVPSFYGLEVLRAAEGVLPGFDELSRRADRVGEARLGWPAPSDPLEAIDEAEHDLALLSRVLRREEADATGTARYLLGANPHLARALRARARRWGVGRFTAADGLVDPRPPGLESLARHGLRERSFSPTALQNFAACPYRFLLYTIHKLETREPPEAIEHIDPLSRGSLIHDVQFELLTWLRAEGLLPVTSTTLEAARARLDTTLDRVAARYRDDLAPAIERVWEDAIAGIRADLREWLRRATEEPQWVPWRFELSFGLTRRQERDPHSTPDPVLLDSGLTLRGSVDLVERDATDKVRVTDHKTGKAWVKEGAVVAGGEALQPVLYALAAEKLFPDREVVAGRLYYCTARGEFTERVMPLDDRARLIASEVVRVIDERLQAASLPAAPSEGACRWCDYASVCGPWEESRLEVKRNDLVADLEHLRSLK
jgi:RecB family exonuclease